MPVSVNFSSSLLRHCWCGFAFQMMTQRHQHSPPHTQGPALGRCKREEWKNMLLPLSGARKCQATWFLGSIFCLSVDLLQACSLANTSCAIANIMTALIFIIVSRLHAFFLVVAVRSSLHVLVAVLTISCFQHTPQ